MDLYEGLLSRRTVHKYEDRAVPEDALLRALEAARWAPNHKLTEPWRFCVVGEQTRARLGEVAARLGEKKAAGFPDDEKARQIERARSKIRDLPALLVISYTRSPDDAFRDREDYAAACCAVHNLQLSLWADGLGTQWSTGGVTRDDETYEILGVDREAEDIIGFLKVGYPKTVPQATRARTSAELTRRLP
jgi:nitroreductase